jgi:selenocysteine-specific elongation factor
MMAAADGPRDRLVALVTVREEVLTDHALARAGAGTPDLQSAEDAGLVRATDWLIAPDRWKLLSGLAVQAVVGTHQRRPALAAVDPAVPRTLLSTTGADPTAVQAVLDHAVATGMLEQIPGGLRAPGHEPRLTVAQQVARTALLGVLQQGGIETEPLRGVAEQVEADGDLLDALVREGQIVMLDGNSRAVTRAAFDQAVQALAALPGPFTASQAREVLGTSRKYLLPLLEAMDAAGLTRRQGDHRTLT